MNNTVKITTFSPVIVENSNGLTSLEINSTALIESIVIHCFNELDYDMNGKRDDLESVKSKFMDEIQHAFNSYIISYAKEEKGKDKDNE